MESFCGVLDGLNLGGTTGGRPRIRADAPALDRTLARPGPAIWNGGRHLGIGAPRCDVQVQRG
jgi:hypothetical protein